MYANKRYEKLKRFLDFSLSLILITVGMPFFILISLFIIIESPGSPVFCQKRIGRFGRSFTCYKFRTMRKNAPHNIPKKDFIFEKDYLTRVGRLLRKTSLDETLQLFNVLLGDMSLVGPRPVIKEELLLNKLRRKYNVYRLRPGITGLAQVCGRDVISDNEKAELDRIYAENLCFASDFIILRYTVKRVIKCDRMKNGKEANLLRERDLGLYFK